MHHNPIICAIDTIDVEQADRLISSIKDYVGVIKLGLEFFTANGAAGVRELEHHRLPIFLDLKFHDIPNTVAKAIKATAGINSYMMTVHTGGGRAMLQAAIDASNEVANITGTQRPLIIGVTVLTSMDHADLRMTGVRDDVHEQVKRLADLAQSAGLDGVVCSPHEISMLREQCGNEFMLVVPGIRPHTPTQGGGDDQKRTLSPPEALKRGADYLVIGRPITDAEKPHDAAREIFHTLQAPSL